MEYNYLSYLTTDGIIFMVVGWSLVIGLLVYTMYKVQKNPTNLKQETDEEEEISKH